jgi:hypothetical protein
LGWAWTISRLLKIQTPARTLSPSRSSIKCSEIYRWTWLGVYWGQSLVSFKSWLQLCTRRWTWWILDNYSLLLCTRCILEMIFQESKWNLVWHAYTMGAWAPSCSCKQALVSSVRITLCVVVLHFQMLIFPFPSSLVVIVPAISCELQSALECGTGLGWPFFRFTCFALILSDCFILS